MKKIFFAGMMVLLCVCVFLHQVQAQTHQGDESNELQLSDVERQSLLTYTRLSFDGEEISAQKIKFSKNILQTTSPVIVALFDGEGNLLGMSRVDDPKTFLKDKIDKALTEIHRTIIKTPVSVHLPSFIQKIKKTKDPYKAKSNFFHIMVVSDTARFPNLGIKGLFDHKIYEPQVTGLAYELGDKRVELNPIEALRLNLGSKGSRSYLAKKLGVDPKKIPELNDLVVEVYRVIHFGESFPDRKYAKYHRGHQVFLKDQVDDQEIMKRLKLIGEWYAHNVKDGEVTYEYHPATGEYKNQNRTMVRSTMSVWVLNRLAFFLNEDHLKTLGEETIQYYLERYFQMSESIQQGKILPSEKPTGVKMELAKNRYTTASFLVAAILERGEFQRYQKEITLLMSWVMSYQKGDGIFWTQYAQSQFFMPGQLLLTVASLYGETKDQKYKEFFDKSFQAYAPAIQALMRLGQKQEAPYAPAWFTQPFAKMYALTKEKKYLDMVFLINDRVATWYDLNQENQVYFDYDGILAPKAGSSGNTSVTAASLESLVDAAHVAKLSGDPERLDRYLRVIKGTVAYLMRLQYTPANTYYIRKRERVVGGFKTDLINTNLWMDNVWHLTSAFMKISQYQLLP